MPHDMKGNLIKQGDAVMIPCKVLSVQPGAYCTTDVETLAVMPGNGTKSRFSALNAAQTIRVPDNPAKALYEAYRGHTGGVSLASGQPIPEWEALRTDIQAAWGAAAAVFSVPKT